MGLYIRFLRHNRFVLHCSPSGNERFRVRKALRVPDFAYYVFSDPYRSSVSQKCSSPPVKPESSAEISKIVEIWIRDMPHRPGCCVDSGVLELPSRPPIVTLLVNRTFPGSKSACGRER